MPLVIATALPFGSVKVIVVESLLAITQPAGTVTVNVAFDALPPLAGVAVGEAIGLGVPAGDGLGNRPVEFAWLEFRLLRNAYAVPAPAMITIRPITALTMRTHGVRWTGGCG